MPEDRFVSGGAARRWLVAVVVGAVVVLVPVIAFAAATRPGARPAAVPATGSYTASGLAMSVTAGSDGRQVSPALTRSTCVPRSQRVTVPQRLTVARDGRFSYNGPARAGGHTAGTVSLSGRFVSSTRARVNATHRVGACVWRLNVTANRHRPPSPPPRRSLPNDYVGTVSLSSAWNDPGSGIVGNSMLAFTATFTFADRHGDEVIYRAPISALRYSYDDREQADCESQKTTGAGDLKNVRIPLELDLWRSDGHYSLWILWQQAASSERQRMTAHWIRVDCNGGSDEGNSTPFDQDFDDAVSGHVASGAGFGTVAGTHRESTRPGDPTAPVDTWSWHLQGQR